MITPPPGWTVERTEDGWLMAPPEGAARLMLHYVERRRPIRRAIDLVRAARAPSDFVESSISAPRRLVTIEGEHAALVTRAGMLRDSPCELSYGFVFLDDFYAMVEAVSIGETASELVEQLIVRDVHLLGRERRRRVVYTPPPGWQGTGNLFEARWYPLDHPANPARILVNPALPNTPGLVRGLLERLGLAPVAAPSPLTSAQGLSGEHHHLANDTHLFLLEDEHFLYSVRADAALDTARALVDSLEPVPSPHRADPATFVWWAD